METKNKLKKNKKAWIASEYILWIAQAIILLFVFVTVKDIAKLF